jgi:hypothetical protein
VRTQLLCRWLAALAVCCVMACSGAPGISIANAADRQAAPAGAAAAALIAEVRKSFTINGKPIPPEIFRDFGDGDMADSGAIWVTVDLNAAVGSNLYYDAITDDHGWFSQKTRNTEEVTGYTYYGAAANGLLVVLTSWSGGGSGNFIYLHILDLAAALGLDNDGNPYQRINLTNIRSVALGDRWSGQVSIAKNTIHIATERNGPGDRTDSPPATIEAAPP